MAEGRAVERAASDRVSPELTEKVGRLASELHRALPSAARDDFFQAPHGIAMKPEIADATKESLSNPLYARLFPEGDAVDQKTLDSILAEPDVDQIQVLRAVEAFKILRPPETMRSFLGRLSRWSYDTRAETQINNVEKALQKNFSVDSRTLETLLVRVDTEAITHSIRMSAQSILEGHLEELDAQTIMFLIRTLGVSGIHWLGQKEGLRERMIFLIRHLSLDQWQEISGIVDASGNTWMHFFAAKGDPLFVHEFIARFGEESFLALTRNVNQNKQSWLHLAAMMGHSSILEEAVTNLSSQAMLTLNQETDQVEQVSRDFHGRTRNYNEETSWLEYAAKNRLVKPISMAIDKLTDEQVANIGADDRLNQLLGSVHRLANDGEWGPVERLVERMPEIALFKLLKTLGTNWFEIAAEKGAWEPVRKLLDKLPPEHVKILSQKENFDGKNWVEIAARNNQAEFLTNLVQKLPLEQLRVITNDSEHSRNNWILLAAGKGLWAPIEKIIELYGVDVLLELSQQNSRDGKPCTSMLYEASRGNHISFVEGLLSKLTEAQILKLNIIEIPFPWLFEAAIQGMDGVIETLIKRVGAARLFFMEGGGTLLEEAAYQMRTNVLKLFLHKIPREDLAALTDLSRGSWLVEAKNKKLTEVIDLAKEKLPEAVLKKYTGLSARIYHQGHPSVMAIREQLSRPSSEILAEAGFPPVGSRDPVLEDMMAFFISFSSKPKAEQKSLKADVYIDEPLKIFYDIPVLELDDYLHQLSFEQFITVMRSAFNYEMPRLDADIPLDDEKAGDLRFIFNAMGEHSPFREEARIYNRDRFIAQGDAPANSLRRYASLVSHVLEGLPEGSRERHAYAHVLDILRTSILFASAMYKDGMKPKAKDYVAHMGKLLADKSGQVVFSIANAGDAVTLHRETPSGRYVTYKEFRINANYLKQEEFWHAYSEGFEHAKDLYAWLETYAKRSSEAAEGGDIYVTEESILPILSESHAMALHFLPGPASLPLGEDLSARDQTIGSCSVRSANEAIRRSLFLALGREGYKKFRELFKKQIQIDYSELLEAEPVLGRVVSTSVERASIRTKAAAREKNEETFEESIAAVNAFIKESTSNFEQFRKYLSGQRTAAEWREVSGKHPMDPDSLLRWMRDPERTPGERQKICMFHLEHVDPVLADT